MMPWPSIAASSMTVSAPAAIAGSPLPPGLFDRSAACRRLTVSFGFLPTLRFTHLGVHAGRCRQLVFAGPFVRQLDVLVELVEHTLGERLDRTVADEIAEGLRTALGLRLPADGRQRAGDAGIDDEVVRPDDAAADGRRVAAKNEPASEIHKLF